MRTSLPEQPPVNGPSAQGDSPVVTFFVPCLNEERNVCPTLETIDAAVREAGLGSYEVLVIDDCSTDGTVAAAEAFCRAHPALPIRIKTNTRNMGLGNNYIEGAFLGRGVHYMLVNGDNAEPVSSLVAILSQLGKADMVIPYFGERDVRGRNRRWVSAFFAFLVNVASGRSLRYYNGPVLHLRYNVMRWHSDTEGFAYQAEIITRLLEHGATYVEVQVENAGRQSGISKAFTMKNFLSVSHSLVQIGLRRLRRIIFHR